MVPPLRLLPGQDDQWTSAHSCTASVLYYGRLLVSGAQWGLFLLCHAGDIVHTCYNWTGDLTEILKKHNSTDIEPTFIFVLIWKYVVCELHIYKQILHIIVYQMFVWLVEDFNLFLLRHRV